MAVIIVLLVASCVALSLPLAFRGRSSGRRTPTGHSDAPRRFRGDERLAAAVDEAVEHIDRTAQAREGELTRRLLAGRLDRTTYRSRMDELAHGGSTQVGGAR